MPGSARFCAYTPKALRIPDRSQRSVIIIDYFNCKNIAQKANILQRSRQSCLCAEQVVLAELLGQSGWKALAYINALDILDTYSQSINVGTSLIWDGRKDGSNCKVLCKSFLRYPFSIVSPGNHRVSTNSRLRGWRCLWENVPNSDSAIRSENGMLRESFGETMKYEFSVWIEAVPMWGDAAARPTCE